jgi:hypothetical protein
MLIQKCWQNFYKVNLSIIQECFLSDARLRPCNYISTNNFVTLKKL